MLNGLGLLLLSLSVTDAIVNPACAGAMFQQGCSSPEGASRATAGGTSRRRRTLHNAPGSSAEGLLDFQRSLFRGNKAVGGGGGAVYMTDAGLVQFDTSWPSAVMIQELASSNVAMGEAGYGSGLASGPSTFLVSSDWSSVQLQAVPEAAAGTAATRSAELPSSSAMSSSSNQSSTALRVPASRLTTLIVRVLDAFGSVVLAVGEKSALTLRLSSRPSTAGDAAGHNSGASQQLCSSIPAQCAQQCSSLSADTQADCSSGSSDGSTAADQPTCTTACLSGATTVAFKQGVAVFDSLRVQATPNTSWTLHMQPQGITSLQSLQVPLQVWAIATAYEKALLCRRHMYHS
jgi:predicted outer membrane repeat protein